MKTVSKEAVPLLDTFQEELRGLTEHEERKADAVTAEEESRKLKVRTADAIADDAVRRWKLLYDEMTAALDLK